MGASGGGVVNVKTESVRVERVVGRVASEVTLNLSSRAPDDATELAGVTLDVIDPVWEVFDALAAVSATVVVWAYLIVPEKAVRAISWTDGLRVVIEDATIRSGMRIEARFSVEPQIAWIDGDDAPTTERDGGAAGGTTVAATTAAADATAAVGASSPAAAVEGAVAGAVGVVHDGRGGDTRREGSKCSAYSACDAGIAGTGGEGHLAARARRKVRAIATGRVEGLVLETVVLPVVTGVEMVAEPEAAAPEEPDEPPGGVNDDARPIGDSDGTKSLIPLCGRARGMPRQGVIGPLLQRLWSRAVTRISGARTSERAGPLRDCARS